MIQNKVPITRERYIGLNYGSEPPKPWTFEHESELPIELQRLDWFEEEEGQLIYKGEVP